MSRDPVRAWQLRANVVGLAFVLVAVFTSEAFATLNLYEPFNYTAGQGLAGVNGQAGFGGASGNTAASVVPSPQGGSGSPYGQLAPNGNYWMTAGYTATGNDPYDQSKDAVTVSTDLSYSGLADPTGGGSIELGGTGSTPRLAFAAINNDLVSGTPVAAYYSLLVQIKDISSMQAIGGLIGGFNNTRGSQGNNPSTVGAALYIRASSGGAKFQFGVAEQSTNAGFATYDTTQEFDFNATYLIVGKYTINGTLNTGGTGGTSDDTAQIWINPTSLGGAEPSGTLVTTINNLDIPTNQTDPGPPSPDKRTVQTFIFRQDGTSGSNSPTDYIIDDLRVGTTFADVTPVPGVAGDYNGDNKDAADYVAWRMDPSSHGGDPGGYNAWRGNFGSGAGSGSGSGLGSGNVPEPGGLAIVSIFAAAGIMRLRNIGPTMGRLSN